MRLKLGGCRCTGCNPVGMVWHVAADKAAVWQQQVVQCICIQRSVCRVHSHQILQQRAEE